MAIASAKMPSKAFPAMNRHLAPELSRPEGALTVTRDEAPTAAGLILQAYSTGNCLFIKRGDKQDHSGEWSFPAGGIEPDEPPMVAAIREAREETGFINEESKEPCRQGVTTPDHVATWKSDGVNFTLYKLHINNEFIPTLNDESSAYAWAPLDKPPQPVHTGFNGTGILGAKPEKASQEPSKERAADKQLAEKPPKQEHAPKEHVKAVEDTVYKVADSLGFPKDRVKIVNKYVPHDIPGFDPNGIKAQYDFDTKNITFYPVGLEHSDASYIRPVFEHELMHAKFDEFVSKNKDSEAFKKLISDPKDLEKGAQDVSGYAKASFARYKKGEVTLIDALHETLGDMIKYSKEDTSSPSLNRLFRLVVRSPIMKVSKAPTAKDNDYVEQVHRGRLPRAERDIRSGSFIGSQPRGSFVYHERSRGSQLSGFQPSFVGDVLPRLDLRRRLERAIAMDRQAIIPIRARGGSVVGRLANDESVRSYDADGRLHVKIANISKATVNPYIGNEIPDFDKLGLEANKIYYLYRDPDELVKGAATFNGVPLLSEHKPVTAGDHDQKLTVGSIGNEAIFEFPYLKNSLVVWPEQDIKRIEKNDKRQLSAGYRYRADMTPGTSPRGERYDGVMRDIVGNHVALVEEGRAGADVVVGDKKLVH